MPKNSLEGLPEEDIVRLAQKGEDGAQEFLLEKYKNIVRSKTRSFFLVGAESEDLLQEGMIGLFKAIRDYEPEKCSSFQAFAVLCIKRQLISAFKAASRQKHIPLNSYISLNKPVYGDDSERTYLDVVSVERAPDPEQLFILGEEKSLIEKKIREELSQFEREVLRLYLSGKSYQEIAEQLGHPPKSIDNALQRMKKKLERTLRARLSN